MTPELPSRPLSGWRAALLIGTVAFVGFFLTRAPSSRQTLGEAAPELSLPDLAGKTVSLADFKGRVVLLDFWATWCGPCQEELPDIIALHQKFRDKGFTVLGVAMDVQGKKTVAPFVADNKIPYPMLLTGGDAPKGWDVPGLPTAFLVDRRGRVVRSYVGEVTAAEVTRDVEAVITP